MKTQTIGIACARHTLKIANAACTCEEKVEALKAAAKDLIGVLRQPAVKYLAERYGSHYALQDAQQALAAMESEP